jgi:hypothetical protein
VKRKPWPEANWLQSVPFPACGTSARTAKPAPLLPASAARSAPGDIPFSNPHTALAAPRISLPTLATYRPLPRSFPRLQMSPDSCWLRHPPYGSNTLAARDPPTTARSSHPSAPVPQNAIDAPAADGTASACVPGPTNPLPTSIAAASRRLPGCRDPLADAPLPMSGRIAHPAGRCNAGAPVPESAAVPYPAALDSKAGRRSGVPVPWRLPPGTAA